MRVFLMPRSFSGERSFTLTGKDFHYLVHVLRFREGATCVGRASDGSLWNLLINKIDSRRHICTVTCSPAGDQPERTSNPLPSVGSLPEIHLYQCVLKGKKFDALLRQAVEIGVSRIIPVQSAYTVPDLFSKDSKNKERRWQLIRDEALQQCGSSVMTQIAPPIRFRDLTADWDSHGLGIFFHHEPIENRSLTELITGYRDNTGSSDFPVSLVIGPEGGLSDEEIADMKKAGFLPAFLKTNILRAETAAIYAAACTQMIMTDIDQLKKFSAFRE